MSKFSSKLKLLIKSNPTHPCSLKKKNPNDLSLGFKSKHDVLFDLNQDNRERIQLLHQHTMPKALLDLLIDLKELD